MQPQTRIAKLDHWLEGQIPPGQCIEWGLPRGQGAYKLIVFFLRHYAGIKIWLYDPENKKPYPPAWAAWGVDLSKIYFAATSSAVADLKPLFQDTVCQFFVLDGTRLSQGDFCFLKSQARQNNQLIFILRPYLLSPQRGNPFVYRRFNCTLDSRNHHYVLRSLRGPFRTPLKLPLSEIWSSLEFT